MEASIPVSSDSGQAAPRCALQSRHEVQAAPALSGARAIAVALNFTFAAKLALLAFGALSFIWPAFPQLGSRSDARLGASVVVVAL